MNKRIIVLVTLLIIGIVIGYYGMQCSKKSHNYTEKAHMNEKFCALRRGMGNLWAEHVLWTRQFIVSSVAGLQDADAAAQRLLKNQDDIGNAIAPFYGEQAGAQLATLLREHITIAADIVKAALANNNQQVKTLDAQWHTNAANIATFLSNANPHWSQNALVTMLKEHLKLTTIELQLRMKADWDADIVNFDKIFMQAQMMGKDLADGIRAQFPDKF